MNPKTVAGISGVAGLAILGLIGTHMSGQSRARRDLLADVQDLSDDSDFVVDDLSIFEDDWTKENNTDLWEQFQRDLGVELDDDDVSVKQRRINWSRFKENQIPGLHNNMQQEYTKRIDALEFFNEISGASYGRRDPSEFGESYGDEKGGYEGYDDMAPQVEEFLDAFQCSDDGSALHRAGGKTSFWFLFPAGVPLFTSRQMHVKAYAGYWEFLIRMAGSFPVGSDTRLSIGVYGNGAVFTPRGYKFRKNMPWSRISRFYKKPRMMASRPKFFASLNVLLSFIPRYGQSTAAAGDNCYLFWFFHDVPQDLNDFMIPENYEDIRNLHNICQVLPIIIAPNADHEMWKKFTAQVVPGLQTHYSKDPEFSSVWYLKDFSELSQAQFIQNVNQYMCLVENRATCRIRMDGFVPPPSASPTEAEPTESDFRGIQEEYAEYEPEAPAVVATESEPEATEAGKKEKKEVEIDSCCGHNQYSGTPFDSELRTCCSDGKVRAYEFEGDDPCLSAALFG